MSELSFNVLTDRWIPLDGGAGPAAHASVVELLAGERDAPDLVHARDDCRFFARMLLSALAQALFPARDAGELKERIAHPLAREVVERRVAQVEADFELVGPRAFMQTELTPEERKHAKKATDATEASTPSLFLDVPRKSRHLLFRPASTCAGVCPRCAVLLVYGIQAFAMEDGQSGFGLRGKSPSVRGAPATTTLLALASVRSSVWANVLHGQRPPRLGYATDSDQPWRQERVSKPDGAPFGLLEGLFWQPRAFRLAAIEPGSCFACGAVGARLAPVAWRSKSKAADGALFQHPYSPLREDKKTRALSFLRLGSERPAWAGLVDLMSPIAGVSGRTDRVIHHAAPVVRQWHDSLGEESASLLVFDVGTTRSDRATPASRFCDSFPLSARLAVPEVADAVRALVARAEDALDALRQALKRVHDKGKKPREGYWAGDVRAAFWARSEVGFWRAYEGLLAGDEAPARALSRDLRATALDLFDRATEASLADPGRLARVVRQRQWLERELHRRLFPETVGAAVARAGGPRP